ncbi:hypothetical protein [Tsukamurella sp. NPDC003166]|uniref:hypothetical protein n=1 Tax=Tsukamurella sp. NPDC003166 TaxID=3154444 RepID=UPI0033B6DAE1
MKWGWITVLVAGALVATGCSSSTGGTAVPTSTTTSAASQGGGNGIPAGRGSFKLDGAYVQNAENMTVMCTVTREKTTVLTVGVSISMEVRNAVVPQVTKFSYLSANGVLEGAPAGFRLTHDGDATVVTGNLSGTVFTAGGAMESVTKPFEFRYTC